jgi:hypothetical protein
MAKLTQDSWVGIGSWRQYTRHSTFGSHYSGKNYIVTETRNRFIPTVPIAPTKGRSKECEKFPTLEGCIQCNTLNNPFTILTPSRNENLPCKYVCPLDHERENSNYLEVHNQIHLVVSIERSYSNPFWMYQMRIWYAWRATCGDGDIAENWKERDASREEQHKREKNDKGIGDCM